MTQWVKLLPNKLGNQCSNLRALREVGEDCGEEVLWPPVPHRAHTVVKNLETDLQIVFRVYEI